MRLAGRLLLAVSGLTACSLGATDPGLLSAGPPTQLDTGIDPGVDMGAGTTEVSTGASTGGAGHNMSSSGVGSSGAGDSDPAGGSSSGAMMADMGMMPDFPAPLGCQGKIDVMFVISSNWHAKMAFNRLQAAYVAFVEMLQTGPLAALDYHVMVVDAAGEPGLDSCWECYQCEQYGCDGPGCSDWGGPPDYPCQTYFGKCDGTDGVGVTLNGNWDASNKRCELYGGNRYIITGEPKLLDNFVCMASVGAGPRTDVAGQMVMKALEPKLLGPKGCNAGFVRPDALLVVIVIQGDLDTLSYKSPPDWYESMVDAKGGDEDAVLVMALATDRDQLPAVCPGVQLLSNPWREATTLAKHGLFASICEPSYVPFLEQGAAMAVELCDNPIPP